MRSKKAQTQKLADPTYRVRILAPDSATKWVPTQLLGGKVQELKPKAAARKRAKSHPQAQSQSGPQSQSQSSAHPGDAGPGHSPGSGQAEAA